MTHLKAEQGTVSLSRICVCTENGAARALLECPACQGKGEVVTTSGQALIRFLSVHARGTLPPPPPEYVIDGPTFGGQYTILRQDGMCIAQFGKDYPGGPKAAAETALFNILHPAEDDDD